MTVNPGRDKIWLAIVDHRAARVKRCFHSEEAAQLWVKDRRGMSPVVAHSIEAIWLVD